MPQFQKENLVGINQEFEFKREEFEPVKFQFKIVNSINNVEMELAKGHLELREEENNQSFHEIKLFSTAIPDNISKKSKPLIPQNNAFLKGDRLKKD